MAKKGKHKKKCERYRKRQSGTALNGNKKPKGKKPFGKSGLYLSLCGRRGVVLEGFKMQTEDEEKASKRKGRDRKGYGRRTCRCCEPPVLRQKSLQYHEQRWMKELVWRAGVVAAL